MATTDSSVQPFETICINYLTQTGVLDLKYFEGRNILVRKIPVVSPDDLNPDLVEHFNLIERKPKLIAQALKDLGFNEDHVLKTAIYPSAGYDGATAFLLWPDITTVVAIDDHPFVSSKTKTLTPNSYFSRNDKDQGWSVFLEVNFKNHVAEIVLARLLSAVPNIRIHAVYQILDVTKDNPDFLNLSHGLILFDTGEDTPLRTYVHLESPVLNEYEKVPTSWWHDNVIKNDFQILLRKAAMSFFNYPIGIKLIRHLKSKHGLLIDGDSNKGSFSNYDFEKEVKETPRLNLPIEDFGYGSVSRIYFFY